MTPKIFLLLICAAGLALAAAGISACTTKHLDEYGEGGPDFFKHDLSGICFARYGGDWRRVSTVPCEIADPRLHPKLEWVQGRIWYFQDRDNGLCIAAMQPHGNLHFLAVDCGKVDHLLRPAADPYRYRVDTRVKGN